MPKNGSRNVREDSKLVNFGLKMANFTETGGFPIKMTNFDSEFESRFFRQIAFLVEKSLFFTKVAIFV